MDNKKKFKKAEIRSKSNKTSNTKRKNSSVNKRKTSSAKRKNSNAPKRPETPVNIKINAIERKYGGVTTPSTPKRNYTFKKTATKRRESNIGQQKEEEAAQHVEYLKMQKLYRMLKKDLKKLKSDSKALEIQKRRIAKDGKKLLRDKEQFEIDTRTANLKRDNINAKKGGKYTILEEDKLRKMLYAERKQWNEERKNLRAEILRIQAELGNVRHSNNSQRNSLLKPPGSILSHNNNNNNTNKNVGPIQKHDYSRQQKELQRFIRIEKQKAMNEIVIEKKKLAMLAKQLRADHERLKKKQAIQRNGNKWTPKQMRMDPKIFVDKTVKKIYIDPKHRRPYERKGNIIKYKPKKTRIVYRDLRKKVILKTHEWDTKIKYLNGKGKELNHIKKRIVTLEEKIDKKTRNKRVNNMNNMDINGSDDDDSKMMEMDTEVMQEADTELAQALEELDELQSEYMTIEQDMESTVDELQQGEVKEEEYETQRLEMEKFEKESPQLIFELKGSNNYRNEKKNEIELKDERDNNYRNVNKPHLPQFQLKGSNNMEEEYTNGYRNIKKNDSDTVLRLGDVNNYRNKKQYENEDQYTNNYRTQKDNGLDLNRDNNYRNKKVNENEDHGMVIQNECDMSDGEFELELRKIQQSEMNKGYDINQFEQLENNKSITVTNDIDMEEALAQIEMSPEPPEPEIRQRYDTPLQLKINTNDGDEIEMDGIQTNETDDNFEYELLKLEKALTIKTVPKFEKHVSHMEQIVTEQAEEAGTLRQVIESLSERLAGAQLEIDGLKEQVRAAKRRQKLRDLYMKMAYSDLPEYKFMQSADETGYYNNNKQQKHFINEQSNAYLNVNNMYNGTNRINNRKSVNKNKQVKFSDSGSRVTSINDNKGEGYGKNGMRIKNGQQQQPQFSDSNMIMHYNEMNNNVTNNVPFSESKTNDKMDIKIVDNDGNEVFDIDKAMGIIFNPYDYSPAMIIKAAKAIYANGLIDDRRNYMSGNNIVNGLLDIIQYNGKLATNPECEPVVKAALKALIPLLDNNKCRNDFFKKGGIDIFDNLFGPNMDTLQHMYGISGLIADGINKVVNDANENDKLKIDDIMVKLCHILNKTYSTDKGKKLLTHFGEILEKMDIENQINLMKPLIDAGILNITTNCALANASDHKGVCDTFGLCYDHIAQVDAFLHNNKNISIDDLIDAIDLYSHSATADVLTHVLDGMLSMILNDPNSKSLVKQFKDKGLEHVLIRALNNVRDSMNIIEEKYDNGSGNELSIKFDSNDINDNPIIESIADFYNTLQFEKLKPKMSQLKVKLNEFGIPLYGTQEWIDIQKPHNILNGNNNPLSPQAKILEDLYVESQYEFDESDAIQMVKDRINKRINHPQLCDMGAFLSRIGKSYNDKTETDEKDEYNTQQMVIMKQINDNKNNDNNNNNKNESKMSKLFSGMFRNKKKKENKNFHSEKSVIQLKLDRFDSQSDVLSPSKSISNREQNMFVQNNNNNKLPSKPNRIFQQQRMFLKKYDKNGRKRIPKYDDFMNEAFNNKIGRGLNEVQQVFNEMSHHAGLVKPVGSMLQKWYVLANHGTQYWISPTNKELSKYNESHDDYYDMNDDEKFNDCWLLYDMKRKRMIQEIRWKNRGHMNDPKYITIQCANDEETPWRDISNAYLEKTDDEQIIKVNKKSRYWRILFLGNHGEDTDDAPRFVFYEVQFWGRRHSTMNYSKAATIRKKGRSKTGSKLLNVNYNPPHIHKNNNRSNSISKSRSKSKSKSKSNTFSKSKSNRSNYKQHKIGYGDNAKKGKKFKTNSSSGLSIEMTGKSKFTTVPL